MLAPEPDLADLLLRFDHDAERQLRWQRDLASGAIGAASNPVREPLLPPPANAVQAMPEPGSPRHRELAEVGRQAIARGELGVLVLNGGMATRFGGVVKGVVPAHRGRSFLALAIGDALRHATATGGRVPVLLMNSFATDAATRAHLAEHRDFGAPPGTVRCFSQSVALRMTKAGEVFRTAAGAPSPYGPGHGDCPASLRRSGELQRFVAAGGRHLLIRNVDNLGARICPAILGHHITSGRELTCELVDKRPGDAGGSPYLLRDRVQIVEQIRYPGGRDPGTVDVFNCNTFTCSARALDRDFDLGWYYVEKQVEGRVAVQIERLIGELTAHLSTDFLRVPRDGAHSRFLPIKKPDDLVQARAEIAAVLAATA